MNWLKKPLRTRKSVVIFILFIIISCLFLFFITDYDYWHNNPIAVPWKYTDPLSFEVALDLCEKLSISLGDLRCQTDSTVYAPDFDKEVKIIANSGKLQTFADWEAYFGKYQSYCGPKTPDFQCDYDFHGDGVFLIYVFFDAEGNMTRWRFSILDD
ncbi:MAG: hypothetical protein H6636_09020 [Anaerolineales bacterium]|nr:hypothetical protein [Anaerolineales bacterium]